MANKICWNFSGGKAVVTCWDSKEANKVVEKHGGYIPVSFRDTVVYDSLSAAIPAIEMVHELNEARNVKKR